MMSTGGKINLFLKSTADFLLPRFCRSCNIKLNLQEECICFPCLERIKTASDERLNFEFNKKFGTQKIISKYYSLFIFEKDKELQNAIHSLKYQNRFNVGIFFGKLLGEKLNQKKWEFDLIMPVPLHRLRKAERGYNQSYYIAKGLSKTLNKKVSDRVMKRERYTESQTNLNIAEREQNIRDAFRVIKDKTIEDKSILIVDDVITTGATISECGRVLMENGAKEILAASIAIAD